MALSAEQILPPFLNIISTSQRESTQRKEVIRSVLKQPQKACAVDKRVDKTGNCEEICAGGDNIGIRRLCVRNRRKNV